MPSRSSVRVISLGQSRRSQARWFLAAAILSVGAVGGLKAHASTATSPAASVISPWNLLGGDAEVELAGPHEARLAELSDQEYFSYSGVGAVICTVNGQKQTSTAFLVGSFDLAVTVAHTFVSGAVQASPNDCVYTSTDSTG
ncbi:MAG: hypothetical protein ABW110_10480, partial [Steroidobacteraceae bacterium]